MTDVDRASLDRVLPSTPGSADWDDVMGRFRVSRGRRRRRLVVLAATALVLAAGTASAFGTVRDFFLDRGFIGLPPQGATPSTPESGELEISYWVGIPGRNPRRSRAWVYADGRLIWLHEGDPHQPQLPESANRWSTGFLEQRLTPDGVERLRSEILSNGVFGDDQPPPGSTRVPFYTDIQVRDGDRLVPVKWASDLPRLEARLADPASWLPPSAWQERAIKAYVPTRYAVCYTGLPEKLTEQQSGPERILTLLPAPAEDMLRAKNRTRRQGFRGSPGDLHVAYGYCSDMTTGEARALAKALDDGGLKRNDVSNLNYEFEAPGPVRETIHLDFEPYLPHGETTCSPCG